MGNNLININGFEFLGRVLDGQATGKERNMVLANMPDAFFEECFTVALKAMVLFNEK